MVYRREFAHESEGKDSGLEQRPVLYTTLNPIDPNC